MKYLVILGDGMSDEPLEALSGATPLEKAQIPVLHRLASLGRLGLADTVPKGMDPGSDTANLCILGYDPKVFSMGRSPLEAMGLGVDPGQKLALRGNLLTLSEEGRYCDRRLLSNGVPALSPGEGEMLLSFLAENLNCQDFHLYPGEGYRHLALWDAPDAPVLAQPHDHLGERIASLLPAGLLWELQEKASALLDTHPINLARAQKGLPKANGIWFWGAGRAKVLPSFQSRTGLSGAMIAGVSLMKGIGAATGMEVVSVPGATGSLDTNYEGKARAAIRALLEEDRDFVYVHLEAPDEMSHLGDAEGKVSAIEHLDREIVQPIVSAMEAASEPFRMLILPDHMSSTARRTHLSGPVPYILYDSTRQARKISRFTERCAAEAAAEITPGGDLLPSLIQAN